MKRFIAIVLFVSILAACSPKVSENAVQTAIANTQAAQPTHTNTPLPSPTPTSTPVPLTWETLSTLMILPGDLPSGYSAGQVRDKLALMFHDVPKTNIAVEQELAKGGEQMGGISVLIYDQKADVDTAFQIITKGMSSYSKPNNEVGERGWIVFIPLLNNTQEYAFTRCKTVVHIRMVDLSYNSDPIIAYAKKLDDRLKKIVCP